MALIDNLSPAAETLRAWASEKPFVRRVWIYGSRAKGTPKPDSDLDVALEIDPVGNDEGSYTSFLHEAEGWRAELRPQLEYQLHLKWYDASNAPVREGVNSAGILVYERAT